MTFVEDFQDICQTPVTVSAFIGRDDYGLPQYGSPVVYPYCRISYKPTMVRRVGAPDNQQVVARGAVWIMTTDRFSVEDRIEFPDGETPPILAVDMPEDEFGATHAKVWFG